MTLKLPPLTALRSFEAAARHLSMSRAGDELHVTHAAISYQVRHLEAWFDTELFVRDGRRLKLTLAGELLVMRLTPLFEAMAEACGRVKSISGSNILKVGCIPSIASRWLVPNLAKFSDIRQGVDIRVVYAQANEQLTDSDLDVLITYGEVDAKNVLSRQLFSRINTPVCSPHFLERYGPFDTPSQIASAPLLHDETTAGWQEWCRLAGIPEAKVTSGTIYQDFNLLATAVIAGHGIGLCPVNVFREEIGRGDLVVISSVSIYDDKGYAIVTRRDRSKVVADFVEWFFELTRENRKPMPGQENLGH